MKSAIDLLREYRDALEDGPENLSLARAEELETQANEVLGSPSVIEGVLPGLPEGCPTKAWFSEATGGLYTVQPSERMRVHAVEIHPLGTRASLNGGGWQGMSSAPRDGARILVLVPSVGNANQCQIVSFIQGLWRTDDCRLGWGPYALAGWMPLPAAPTNEAPRGESGDE